MRRRSKSFLSAVARLCVIVLLFAQLLPAQAECRCEMPGSMDCCRVAEQIVVEVSSCCSSSSDGMSIHGVPCARDTGTPSVAAANLTPQAEQGKPQSSVECFLAVDSEESVQRAGGNIGLRSIAPPGAAQRSLFLLCESLLI